MTSVRTRFAPSPTGPLHMGGVRTALYAYLFAKQHNGQFILRIEDTDQNRYVPGAEEYIIEALTWCGIIPDEGVGFGGPHMPYRQSERKEKGYYRQYADQLINAGHAYIAFDTPAELEAKRKEAEAAGNHTWQYDNHSRLSMTNSLTLSAEETAKRMANGDAYVIRLKVEPGTTVSFTDMVRGEVSFDSNLVDDKVMIKADGMPTYHLAHIVDDIMMEITHAIRGEEWLPSAPAHILIYQYLGLADKMPQYAHLPLLLKPEGNGKLSKRDGDRLGFPVFPLEWKDPASGEISSGYREKGYYHDAFVNMLAFLGWNPGTEQEVFSMEELIKAFSFERVHKAGARFDPEKAKWFNEQYLRHQPEESLAAHFVDQLKEKLGANDARANMQFATAAVRLVKDRIHFEHEMIGMSTCLFESPTTYDEKVVAKRWNDKAKTFFAALPAQLNTVSDFTAENTKHAFEQLAAQQELKPGDVLQMFRVLVSGQGSGLDLFGMVALLGKEEVNRRIEAGRAALNREPIVVKNYSESIPIVANSEDIIGLTLNKIWESNQNKLHTDLETETIELKDLSTGNDWNSLKQTICAFLNTKGGYVICGVRERNGNYIFTGFDRNNESNLIALRTDFFINDIGSKVRLEENIDYEYRIISGITIAIVKVRALSEDLKYLKYHEKYYTRVLTQDKEIKREVILSHIEYKKELEYSKEIRTIKNAAITDLDIDKINQFIIKINATGRKETVKKDLFDAASFLERRYCIDNAIQVTVLGMLLFGEDPFRFLEYRAEVDCYFETGSEVSKDKKIFQNDVLNLMDDAFKFVWGHIKVGRSYIGGGRSEPEFPEKLIREVINNAIAHRDYTINRFVTVKIHTESGIEIKNPGSFQQKMIINDEQLKIKRIIPGYPESKNPKLANVLKAFDKIESQGIGMATLVSYCLDSQCDVPYYDLSIQDTISLFIPSGRLLDENTLRWINSFKHYIEVRLKKKMTTEHERVLGYLYKSESLNKLGKFTILLSQSNNHALVLHELEQAEIIIRSPISKEYQNVYILADELLNTNLIPEIRNSFGIEIGILTDDEERVLNIIYRYNKYNNQSVKPNVITPEFYFEKYGKNIDPTKYESLGRKVRSICNALLNRNILVKNEDKTYRFVLSNIDK